MRNSAPILDRFWAKVRKTDACWLWTDRPSCNGYGRIRMYLHGQKRTVLAHRLSWYLAHGNWPTNCVLHRCDVPLCVRPSHLFVGTRPENTADMMAKGRHSTPRGEGVGRSVLTEATVTEARRLYASGVRIADLARRYGIGFAGMRQALHSQTWGWILNGERCDPSMTISGSARPTKGRRGEGD